MFNKEEEKKVVSMDMGGSIEPVNLEKEIEKVPEEMKVDRSTVVPELMKIGPEPAEVPPLVEEPTKVEPEPVKPKPRPVSTIGEVPPITPKPVEEKKEEVKENVKEETKPEVKEEIKEEPKDEVEVIKPGPVITPTPVISPTPVITPVKPKEEVKEEPKEEPKEEIKEEKVEPKDKDLEKTMAMPVIDDQSIYDKQKKEREEAKEKETEENKDLGPNVIAEPLATEDTKKEKKKNPHFFECPPECIPIKPMGYIVLNILYMIPIVGLIMILAHSASYKNLNRRNYARSWLIVIVLIIAIIAALIYFLKIDVIGIIENITGYKIDLQHFKFTKFK